MEHEIRVLIADDHPLLRRGLRQTIESDPMLKVVAEAGDGETALAQVQEMKPTVAALDVDAETGRPRGGPPASCQEAPH